MRMMMMMVVVVVRIMIYHELGEGAVSMMVTSFAEIRAGQALILSCVVGQVRDAHAGVAAADGGDDDMMMMMMMVRRRRRRRSGYGCHRKCCSG
jgi:hypothetical protein